MSNRVYATYDEAVALLVFVFEDSGIFVTAGDLAPLAERVIDRLPDGSASINVPHSTLRKLAAEFVPEMGERADCPITWCTGLDRPAHASLDSNEWGHTGAGDEFAGGLLHGCFVQEGNTVPFYDFGVQLSGSTLLTASGMRALADDFERHAVTLRERAAQLEALGDIL